MPAARKLRGLTTKYLLKRSLRDVHPDEILRRPKKGFGIPLGAWIRRELRPVFQEMLDPARIARQGFFRPETVARFLAEHLAGRQDHRKRLWNLLTFQMWHAAYLDAPPAERHDFGEGAPPIVARASGA